MSKRKTLEDWRAELPENCSSVLSVDSVFYSAGKTMLNISCIKGHNFTIKANMLKKRRGCSCPVCMDEKYNLPAIEARCRKVHKDSYTYLDYNKKTKKVKYECKLCGSVNTQNLYDHEKGHGCSTCKGGTLRSEEDWLKDFKCKYGDNFTYFDFISKLNTQGKYTKYFNIKCNTCNHTFTQNASYHLKHGNCPKCSKRKIGESKQVPLTTINNVVSAQNNEYTVVSYNPPTVKLYCNKHSEEFSVTWTNLKQGQTNCPKCKYDRRSATHSYTLQEWKDKASRNKVDVDKYSLLKFSDVQDKARKLGDVCCSEHKITYTQLLDSYVAGFIGCPKCKTYGRAQQEVYAFIMSLGVEAVQNNRKVLKTSKSNNPKELDIYLPKYSLGIEFNGLIWHSERFAKDKYNIDTKRKLAESLGVQVINIYEDDWNTKQDIVKSIIRNRLGFSIHKYQARKCKLQEITSKEYKDFCESHHIMGYRQAKHKIGVYYNTELVAVAGFSSTELIRYVVKQNTTVVGGLGKVTKWFVRHVNKVLLTYVDLDYFNGNSYLTVGYTKVGETTPKYWYVGDNYKSRKSRQKFQKHKLHKLFDNYDDALTEWENCNRNNYYRLFGCSNLKLVYKEGGW